MRRSIGPATGEGGTGVQLALVRVGLGAAYTRTTALPCAHATRLGWALRLPAACESAGGELTSLAPLRTCPAASISGERAIWTHNFCLDCYETRDQPHT